MNTPLHAELSAILARFRRRLRLRSGLAFAQRTLWLAVLAAALVILSGRVWPLEGMRAYALIPPGLWLLASLAAWLFKPYPAMRVALSDLPARVVWVSRLEEVPKDAKDGMVQEGGLAITFGNIQFQRDGSVQLPASAFIASMIGGGQTYRLEKTGGLWQVTGTTGSRWIS